MVPSSSDEDEQEAQTLVLEKGGDQSRKPPAEQNQAWREAGQEIDFDIAASPPPPDEPDVLHRPSSGDLPHRHGLANESGLIRSNSLPCMASSGADTETEAFDVHEWQRDGGELQWSTPKADMQAWCSEKTSRQQPGGASTPQIATPRTVPDMGRYRN